jgi:hypothetical protein
MKPVCVVYMVSVLGWLAQGQTDSVGAHEIRAYQPRRSYRAVHFTYAERHTQKTTFMGENTVEVFDPRSAGALFFSMVIVWVRQRLSFSAPRPCRICPAVVFFEPAVFKFGMKTSAQLNQATQQDRAWNLDSPLESAGEFRRA